MKDKELAVTVPCHTSAASSITGEVIAEARAALAIMPSGEHRQSLKVRLSSLEDTVEAWKETHPSEDERKRVTAVAIHFFCDIEGERSPQGGRGSR